MVTRVLHLFVALSIFACPLLCRGSLAASGSATKHVCSCCHKSAPTDESAPTPSSHKDCCQCICGGAVIDAGVQIDLDHELGLFAVDLLADCEQAIVTAAEQQAFATHSPPGAGNPGRALRNLFSSLLC